MPLPDVTPEQAALYKDWFHGKRKAVGVGRGGPIMVGPRKGPEKVEDYKLTDSQRSFAEQYRQLKKVEALLQGATLVQQQRTRSLSALWRELNRRFVMLTPPESPTHELSDQEDEEGMGMGMSMGMGASPEAEAPTLPPGADWSLKY